MNPISITSTPFQALKITGFKRLETADYDKSNAKIYPATQRCAESQGGERLIKKFSDEREFRKTINFQESTNYDKYMQNVKYHKTKSNTNHNKQQCENTLATQVYQYANQPSHKFISRNISREVTPRTITQLMLKFDESKSAHRDTKPNQVNCTINFYENSTQSKRNNKRTIEKDQKIPQFIRVNLDLKQQHEQMLRPNILPKKAKSLIRFRFKRATQKIKKCEIDPIQRKFSTMQPKVTEMKLHHKYTFDKGNPNCYNIFLDQKPAKPHNHLPPKPKKAITERKEMKQQPVDISGWLNVEADNFEEVI